MTTIEILTKTCIGPCGDTKPLDEFRQRKLKSGNGLYRLNVCRACDRLAAQQYRLKNPEKTKAALSDWKRKNPEKNAAHSRKSYENRRQKCRETTLRWIASNRERYLTWLREYGKRSVDSLTDTYVAQTIRIPVAQAPRKLIELKRAKIEIHRATQQLLQLIKEKQNGN